MIIIFVNQSYLSTLIKPHKFILIHCDNISTYNNFETKLRQSVRNLFLVKLQQECI